jgi:predicted secreted protein
MGSRPRGKAAFGQAVGIATIFIAQVIHPRRIWISSSSAKYPSSPEKQTMRKIAPICGLAFALLLGCDSSTSQSNNGVLLDAARQNGLRVGDLAHTQLDVYGSDGGYWWYWKIDDSTKVRGLKEESVYTGKPGIIGADYLQTVVVQAVSSGTTAVTFRHYRSWLGDSTTDSTIRYQIVVQ